MVESRPEWRRCRLAGPAVRRCRDSLRARPLAVCAGGAYAVVDCLASCELIKTNLGVIARPSRLAGKPTIRAEKTILWNARRRSLTEIVARQVRDVVWGRCWQNASAVSQSRGCGVARPLVAGLPGCQVARLPLASRPSPGILVISQLVFSQLLFERYYCTGFGQPGNPATNQRTSREPHRETPQPRDRETPRKPCAAS